MRSITKDKILEASIALFSKKGYDSVTTKEIAKQAGVCEMTVFRHFENKRNLFNKAFEQFIFSPTFKTVFENQLEWDLEKDLMRISLYYQDTLQKNQKIILMEFKNDEITARAGASFLRFPIELNKMLIDYFSEMKERGIVTANPEAVAFNLLAVNFGFFMTFLMNKDLNGSTDYRECIEEYVKILVKGITR